MRICYSNCDSAKDKTSGFIIAKPSEKATGIAPERSGWKLRLRLLSVICAAMLLTSACGGSSSGGVMSKDQPGDGKWRDSGIVGSVTESEEIRLEDDFAAAVNKDFIVHAEAGEGTINEIQRSVLQNKKKLLDSLPDEKDANELKKFFDLASDWDVRNREGAEPLRKYLEMIESISSIEDLTAYECDRENNPLGLGLIMPQGSNQSQKDPKLSVLTLDVPSFSLESAGEYLKLSSGGLEKTILCQQAYGIRSQKTRL